MKDLTGQQFGRLTAISFIRKSTPSRARIYWRCDCICGEKTEVESSNLVMGVIQSCGCLRIELLQQRVTTHGQRGSAEYQVWAGMIQRCTNPRSEFFSCYGGRGITICDRWRKFENFIADMGLRPSKQHSLDRHNNDGPYAPENCRWVTSREQANNTRRNRLLTFQGITLTVAQWAGSEQAKNLQLSYHIIFDRVHTLGWSIERALTVPVQIQNRRGGSK